MHRHDSCLPALARLNANRRQLCIEREVRYLKRQASETCKPALHSSNISSRAPGIVGFSDDGLYLMNFEVLRLRFRNNRQNWFTRNNSPQLYPVMGIAGCT